MAIQNRRGVYADFNPDRMTPGEWAVVLSGDPVINDGKSVFICFSAGVVKRMASRDDVIELINNMSEETISELTQAVNAAIELAEGAAEYADQSGDTAMQQAAVAELAANSVKAALDDLADRLENGEFIGPQGPQGIPGQDGSDGANGVVTTMTGQYALQIKEDGHLYLIYTDGDEPPDFHINDSGHLILEI